jgi:hypothetical protein
MEHCRREIEVIEAQIRVGHVDVQGLCLALSDWSGELRLLLADERKKSRRGDAPAAGGNQTGRGQALIE